jgi:hypothetical protein
MSELRRERLSLDAGWRFSFGHAADTKLDFTFGAETLVVGGTEPLHLAHNGGL